MGTRSKEFWVTRIMKIIRDNIASLPSEKEKTDMIGAIQGLRNYFEKVESEMQKLPIDEERQRLLEAIDIITGGLRKAETDSTYSAIFQLPRKGSVAMRRSGSLQDEALVETKLKELRQLPTESILEKLLDENYITRSQLTILARKLRIVTGSHMSRKEIADRIFKRGFANPRGYELLRGASNQLNSEISKEPQ